MTLISVAVLKLIILILWAGQNLHDLYKKAYTPWEWHGPIWIVQGNGT